MNSRLARVVAIATMLAAAAAVKPASAEDAYPSRQITIVVPVAAGSQADVFARMIAEPLQRKFGRPVVVEDRPGGGQIVGTNAVAKAQPDGYTLLHGNLSSLIISPQMRDPVPYNTPRELTGVAMTMSGPSVLVVDPKLPIHNAAELIAYAKANPGKLNYGSHGAGSFTHVSTEMFKGITGIDMVHVPFAGGSKLAVGFLSGQVQVVIFDLVSIREHERAGKARVIAQVGDQRSPLYPDIPLLSETVNPALATDFWMGMAAPAGTPPAVVALLNKEINTIINTPEFKAKGETVSMYPQHKTAAEFTTRLAGEWTKWGDVIRGRKLLVN